MSVGTTVLPAIPTIEPPVAGTGETVTAEAPAGAVVRGDGAVNR